MKTTYPITFSRILGLFCGILLVLCLSWLVGCGNQSISSVEDLQAVSVYTRADQLPRTLDYINSLGRYETKEFQEKVMTGLNRLLETLDPEEKEIDWAPDPMIATLPDNIRQSSYVADLGATRFQSNDAHYLQQSSWLKGLAERIPKSSSVLDFQYYVLTAEQTASETQRRQLQDSDDRLAVALAILHPTLGQTSDDGTSAQSRQLAMILRLFDWTVRNVQPDSTPAWPTEKQVRDQELVEAGDALWPPDMGVAGPGYKRFPWQLLTYGRGDALERSRLFIQLARQLDLDVAMLAVRNESPEVPTRPYVEWLPAAMVGDQLFLFDMQLGLPLPGKVLGSIATLSDIVTNPQLLTNLDLSLDESVEQTDYWVGADQLAGVIALVDAGPEALSWRMKLLQSRLTGSDRLILSAQPTQFADKLRTMDHIAEVRLWHVPYSTHQFRGRLREAMIRAAYDQDILAKVSWVFTEEEYIESFVSFRAAKNLYLRGRFESERNDPTPNAITWFFNFMYSDEEISDIESHIELQQALGLYRKGQDFKQWQAQLAAMKSQMYLIRADAALYLALCHYENGYPATALNWLGRAVHFDTAGRWADAVVYQTARAHEALGDFDMAIELYQKDSSPQRHGNLLRVRQLSEMARLQPTG